MGYETTRWEMSDGVATLTLNRPEVLNAITERMLAELTDAMKQAEQDAEPGEADPRSGERRRGRGRLQPGPGL
jgi:1,4-dihydroxy-2-naphthoyl-CoA synthase